MDRIIDRGLIESKRRIHISLLLSDKPGALMELTKEITDLGANILQATHDRNAVFLKLNESLVDLTLETRGPEHTGRIIKELEKAYEIKN